MRRRVLGLAALCGTATLFACGGGEVVVQAQLETDAGVQPLGEIEIRALPYDRDALFEELAAGYSEPEPAIPDSLVALQQEIAAANAAWSEASNQWSTARDSLQKLSAALQGVSRASPQYRLMFQDYNTQESQERSALRARDQAFTRFTGLQDRYTSQAEEIEARRNAWADVAYAKIDSVIAARLDEMGLEEHVDTADANGVVRFQLDPGEWWIHGRHDLAYEELYWNEPITVQRGDPIQVILNRASAEVRAKF
jgi:hypothetical protein